MNRRYATADENPVLRSRYAQQREGELDWGCEPAIKCDPDAPKPHRLLRRFEEARRVASERPASPVESWPEVGLQEGTMEILTS